MIYSLPIHVVKSLNSDTMASCVFLSLNVDYVNLFNIQNTALFLTLIVKCKYMCTFVWATQISEMVLVQSANHKDC